MSIEEEDNSLKEKIADFLRKKVLKYKSLKDLKKTYWKKWLKLLFYIEKDEFYYLTTKKKTLIIKKDYGKKIIEEKRVKLLKLFEKKMNNNKEILSIYLNKWNNNREIANFKDKINFKEESVKIFTDKERTIKEERIVKLIKNRIENYKSIKSILKKYWLIWNEKDDIINRVKCRKTYKRTIRFGRGNKHEIEEDRKEKKKNAALFLFKCYLENCEFKQYILRKILEKWSGKKFYNNNCGLKEKKTLKKLLINNDSEDESLSERNETLRFIIETIEEIYKINSIKNYLLIWKNKIYEIKEIIKEKIRKYLLKYLLKLSQKNHDLLHKYLIKWKEKNQIVLEIKKKQTLILVSLLNKIDNKIIGKLHNILIEWKNKILRKIEEEQNNKKKLALLNLNVKIEEKNKEKIRFYTFKWKNIIELIKRNEILTNLLSKKENKNKLIENYYLKKLKQIILKIRIKEFVDIKIKELIILKKLKKIYGNKNNYISKSYFDKWLKIIYLINDREVKNIIRNSLIILINKREINENKILKNNIFKWNELIKNMINKEKSIKKKNYLVHQIQKKKKLKRFF